MAKYYVTSGTDPVPAAYADYTIINTTAYEGLSTETGYIVKVSEDSNVVIAGDVDDDVIIRTTGANLNDYKVTTTVLGDTTNATDGSYKLLINAGGEGDVIPTLIVDGDASKFDATIFDSPSGTSTVTVNDGASLNSYTGNATVDNVTIKGTIGDVTTGGGADNITIDGGTVTGTIDSGGADASGDTIKVINGGSVAEDIVTGGGADTVTITDSSVGGTINAGSSDVYSDSVTINNSTVGGDITVGAGANTITVENSSTVTGSLLGGAGDDNMTVDGSTVSGDILSYGGDDNLTLNNATVGGYVNQAGGDDQLTLAGTVNIDGTYSSPTGITFVDASIGQGEGQDKITIESGAVLDTAGVVNQGASPAIGINEDTLEFTDQGDAEAYTSTLGKAGFWDPDEDGIYTVQYNDDLSDKPLGSATGSEGEFTYSGTSFLNVDNTNAGWTCFASGTLIETDRGAVVIEDLAEGDLVMTRDNGLQAIRWIGSSAFSADALTSNEKLRPIRIRRHALAANIPSSDLLVSQQHRVLVRSAIAQKMFGAPEILVAAKQLCQVDGIDVAHDMNEVEYFHMLFDRHEVVISNGAETESLYTGPEALKSLGKAAVEEIFAIFPELKDRDYTPVSARKLANGRMGRKLAVRHAQNHKALVS